MDDCNFNFVDTSNLKRFLVKCCIYPNDALLISIIRRMDLDADARLSLKEFEDGVRPIENFTKGSIVEMKKAYKSTGVTSSLKKSGSSNRMRPSTGAVPRTNYKEIIQSNKTPNEINFAATNDNYFSHYSAMSATHDSGLKPMQYAGAVRPSR